MNPKDITTLEQATQYGFNSAVEMFKDITGMSLKDVYEKYGKAATPYFAETMRNIRKNKSCSIKTKIK